MTNPLLMIDFYKVGHRVQYPQDTTEIYANFTPRFVYPSEALPEETKHIKVFGIKFFIESYLNEIWGEFFKNPEPMIREYHEIMRKCLGDKHAEIEHFRQLAELGYLPLEIRCMREGAMVPIGVPVLTIRNTHREFYWLVNFIESALSCMLWKPMTTATIAHYLHKLCWDYASETATFEHVQYQCHDFSLRGMSGQEDAAISGMGHLTAFNGTDNVPAVKLFKSLYNDLFAESIPATEHSVMTINGSEHELHTIKRLLTTVYPTGMVSIVSDSYDFWRTISEYARELKPIIEARDGKVIFRPDSGNPIDIICGDKTAPKGTPEHKGALEVLAEVFGEHKNLKGYKTLAPTKVGLIYGDGMYYRRINEILERMKQQGWASDSIVFGVGSYNYQYITRDTLGFAMKTTSAVIGRHRVHVYKDPKTGSQKKSAKGLLRVVLEDGDYVLKEQCTPMQEQKDNLLALRFRNGLCY